MSGRQAGEAGSEMAASGDDPYSKGSGSERSTAWTPAQGIPPRRSSSSSFVPPANEFTSGIQPVGSAPVRERRGSVTVSLEAAALLSSKLAAPADVRGAAQLLERSLHVPARASILLVVSTEEETGLGAAILSAANELQIHPLVYLVDPREPLNAAFLKRLSLQVEEVAACIAIQAATPFAPALVECLAAHASAVFLEVPSDAVARQALRADLEELHRLGVNLVRRASSTSAVEILSGLDAVLTVELHEGRAPVHHGGEPAAGKPLRLPAGQLVFECLGADGTLSVDGGIWLEGGAVLGRGSSTKLHVASGFVENVTGSNADEVNEALRNDPSLRRVSGLGFGTNTSLVAGVGVRELDLCMPGAYVLLGAWTDPRTMVAAVPRRPGVRAGSETWMGRGRWARELL